MRIDENPSKALLQVLKDGKFYSTQGPQIYEEEVAFIELHLCCSKVSVLKGHYSRRSLGIVQ